MRQPIFRIAELLTVLSAAVLGLVTLLPLSDSNQWWVRGWDFPRIRTLAAGAMSWPLDHVFHTAQFAIASIRLHESIGSDHFPLTFILCANQD